jgi:hypothetical protein
MKRFCLAYWRPLACVLTFFVALAPSGVWAAEQCEALNPSACIDDLKHTSLVLVATTIWTVNRYVLWIARWLEGFREFLVNEVLASLFDATLLGIEQPFWIVAAVALCLFMLSYALQIVIPVRWVDLRKGLLSILIALVLFRYGSQALVTSEHVRVQVGTFFSQIAQQGVGNAGSFQFYTSSDTVGKMDAPHSIYDGSSTCSHPIARTVDGIYLNDYTALYLLATAKEIHCPDTAGLPTQFTEAFVPTRPIDTEMPEERTRLIDLITEGIIRMGLGFFLALGAVAEQLLQLLFTLTVTTVWLALVLGLIFSLFLKTERMFTDQIDALVNVMKASWLASVWIGVMLALVYQAAAVGSSMAVFGAGLMTAIVIGWQIASTTQLLYASLSNAANSITGGAVASFGKLAGGVASVAMGVATGGTSAALAGGLAALNHTKGGKTVEGGGSAKDSAAYGLGVGLSQLKPARRLGQLARATGLAHEGNSFVEGLAAHREDDPLSWANTKRDRFKGEALAKRRREREHRVAGPSMPADAPTSLSQSHAPNQAVPERQSQVPADAFSVATGPTTDLGKPSAKPRRRTERHTTRNANQQLAPELQAMAEDLNRAPQTPQERARRVAYVSQGLARATPEEQRAIRHEVEQQSQQHYSEKGTLPPIDPAIPLHLRVSRHGVVRATLADASAAPSAVLADGRVFDTRRERVAFGAARPSTESSNTSGTARAAPETTQQVGQATNRAIRQHSYRSAIMPDGRARALVRSGSAATPHIEAVAATQSMPSNQAGQPLGAASARLAANTHIEVAPTSTQAASASSSQAAVPASSQAASGGRAPVQQPTAAPKVVVSTALPLATAQPERAPSPIQTSMAGQRAASQASGPPTVASHVDPSHLAAPIELPNAVTSANRADEPAAPTPIQTSEQPAHAAAPQESPAGSGATAQRVVGTQAVAPLEQTPAPAHGVGAGQAIQPSASQAALPHTPLASQAPSVLPQAVLGGSHPNKSQQPVQSAAPVEQEAEQPSRRSKRPWARRAQQRQADQSQSVARTQSRAALPRASDRRKS